MSTSPSSVTLLLRQVSIGDQQARAELFRHVEAELRKRAGGYLRQEQHRPELHEQAGGREVIRELGQLARRQRRPRREQPRDSEPAREPADVDPAQSGEQDQGVGGAEEGQPAAAGGANQVVEEHPHTRSV